MLASAGYDETVRVWDVDTGAQLHTLLGHTDFVGWVAFSPDGKKVASASFDCTSRLWDLETGQDLVTLSGHAMWVFCVA